MSRLAGPCAEENCEKPKQQDSARPHGRDDRTPLLERGHSGSALLIVERDDSQAASNLCRIKVRVPIPSLGNRFTWTWKRRELQAFHEKPRCLYQFFDATIGFPEPDGSVSCLDDRAQLTMLVGQIEYGQVVGPESLKGNNGFVLSDPRLVPDVFRMKFRGWLSFCDDLRQHESVHGENVSTATYQTCRSAVVLPCCQ